MIDRYSFGCMSINGKEYHSDLIIFPDGSIRDSWRRKRGHKLCIEDLSDLIEKKPEIIIAGTGSLGFMKPVNDLESNLFKNGIEFKALPNNEAIKLFVSLLKKNHSGIGACFHLTC